MMEMREYTVMIDGEETFVRVPAELIPVQEAEFLRFVSREQRAFELLEEAAKLLPADSPAQIDINRALEPLRDKPGYYRATIRAREGGE